MPTTYGTKDCMFFPCVDAVMYDGAWSKPVKSFYYGKGAKYTNNNTAKKAAEAFIIS